MFRTLVVPLDTSPLAEEAAWKAAAIARAVRGTVHLVHVFEPRVPAFDRSTVMDDRIREMERAQFERHLRRLADDIGAHCGGRCELAVLTGVSATAIAKYARERAADLIVLTTHGRTGLSRAWFGSVADALAHRSPVPVLMVRVRDDEAAERRDASADAFERVLIPLDGSRSAEGVLATVRSMRLSPQAKYLLVQVVSPVPLPVIDYPDAGVVTPMAPDVEATKQLAERAKTYLARMARYLARSGATVETNVVVAPSAGPAIVDVARVFRADLVAMTSHGRGASRLLVGSVADKILRGTQCSVLLQHTRANKTPGRRPPAPKKRAIRRKRASARA